MADAETTAMGVEDGFGSCEPPPLPHRKSTPAFCCSMSNKSPTRRQCGIASSSFPLQSSLPPALARNRAGEALHVYFLLLVTWPILTNILHHLNK